MTCENSSEYPVWIKETPRSYVERQKVLTKLSTREINRRLSSASDLHSHSITHQYSSPTKNQERLSLPKNLVFGNTVISPYLVSPLSTSISRQAKIDPISAKRYISSFKTVVQPTNSKQIEQLNSANNHVVIVKLIKENAREQTDGSCSQLFRKHSSLSMATSATSLTPPLKEQFPSFSPYMPSPILKAEGLKRRATHYDSPVTASRNIYLSIPSNSSPGMATSTTSRPSSNPSLFAYGSTVTGGSTVRQRALAETATNSLLITTERLKSNMSSSMRPARQPSTIPTTTSSTYPSSQPPQRNASQNIKSRTQSDKLINSKDLYEYPDPFTNCPQDMLSKLAQLTKLQLETVEWEKKRRFTKKKAVTNGNTQGKDSP